MGRSTAAHRRASQEVRGLWDLPDHVQADRLRTALTTARLRSMVLRLIAQIERMPDLDDWVN